MSNHWHPKSGTRRKGIHPILLDGGGRFDREHAAAVLEWRRRNPEYRPSPARDFDWLAEDTSADIMLDHPWPFVVLLAIAVGVITVLGYMAF